VGIWNERAECAPRSERADEQTRNLKQLVSRAYDALQYYRVKMDEAGLRPEHVQSLGDLSKLPFTTKDDMRANYPYGLFAVPLRDVVRIHSSSGTTGRPTVVGYTRRDLEIWAEACARFITAAGVGSDDIAQVSFGYGLFTGAFGLHYGLEQVGATVVPASSGNTARQLLVMHDFGVTALVCTPSYACHLAEAAEQQGLSGQLKLRTGLFGAESWTEPMRQELEAKLGIAATDNYGLSEVIGPGVAGECLEARNGMHIAEDHFLCEIIDPETLEPVEMGETGELVITSLTKEAVPVIRYRTRDITRLDPEPCPCGRTTLKMHRVVGRSDDMLVVRGTNIFPSQVESVLLEFEDTEPHYLIVLRREGHLDTMEVQVEVSDALFSDRMTDLRALERSMLDRLRSVLGVKVALRLVEPQTLARSEGKAKRVLDLREGGQQS